MVAETKLYTALSIKPEATQDEIKKAYRYVVPRHYPSPSPRSTTTNNNNTQPPTRATNPNIDQITN